MKNLENNWQDQPNYSLRDTIASSLSTPTARSRQGIILATTLAWVEYAQPDAEDFRLAISGFKNGTHFGGGDWEDALKSRRSFAKANPAYTQALLALDTHIAQSLGPRSYGDAQVSVPSEFASSIPLGAKDKAWRMAYSSGCTKPRGYLARIESEGLTIPSLPYQPRIVPEIKHYFDDLLPSIQTFIWDYARTNKLFQYIAEIISKENKHLFYELMHNREEMPDNEEAVLSLPRKVHKKRQVRFMALSHPYQMIGEFWKEFDSYCKNNDFQLAETRFDSNLVKITELIPRVSTLVELETAYMSSV